MRRTIESVPVDGTVVILEDAASGTYELAHWSVEAGSWLGQDGKPSKLRPTHWLAMHHDKFGRQDEQEDGESSAELTAQARPVDRFPFVLCASWCCKNGVDAVIDRSSTALK